MSVEYFILFNYELDEVHDRFEGGRASASYEFRSDYARNHRKIHDMV